jgi:hypothetical protein
MVPDPADLAALAAKYEVLVVLRARRDGGGRQASRKELRELSRRFPGSLRELDTLGQEELRRRAHAVSLAAVGGPQEPWMAWIAAFHRFMLAALLVKAERRGQGKEAPAHQADDEDLAARAGEESGVRLDRTLVRAFARPPAGRLVPLVIAELARRFGVAAEEMSACLFPRRRLAREL